MNKKGFTLLELVIALAVIMIITGGVFLAIRQQDRRALYNAAYQLQADIRYAQRRALIGGRVLEVRFYPVYDMYRIRYARPYYTEIRRVYFQNGVNLRTTNRVFITFQPRGSASGSFTLTLESGRYRRDLTSTVSGGRIDIKVTDVIQ